VMVPLIATKAEFDLVKGRIDATAQAVMKETGKKLAYQVGTMIELPRACFIADKIAGHADFFSFGTNDLTQSALGFSRDDVEGRILATYLERKIAGGDPRVEIMIPLAVTEPELKYLVDEVREVAEALFSDTREGVSFLVGTMVETPRAALDAHDIAEVAEFFSFGTNDLTQMTFGFSRDDVEGRFMPKYLELNLLPANPFETIDVEGVGKLVRDAVRDGRAARPDLKLGICGEHGGDPASVQFFDEIGLDYVSCSPYRVPLARLAAAHAALGTGGPAASA